MDKGKLLETFNLILSFGNFLFPSEKFAEGTAVVDAVNNPRE